MSIEGARVAWTEGLFLRPQHFQQLERHLHWLLQTRVSQVAAFGHGFSKLVLDEGLLRQGKVALRTAVGILEDGSPFALDPAAATVAPLDVPAGCRDEWIYLCARLERHGAQSFPDGTVERATRKTRHDPYITAVHDNTSASDDATAELQLGALSLFLALKSTLEGGVSSLPVARIRERSGNEVILDPTFVPPMLDAMAQPVLRGWVEELFGLVKQRGDMLETRLGQQGSKGVGDFLLLQSCNRYEPLLAQWRAGVPVHPRHLHEELLKFAGECRTVDLKSRRVPPFPTYAHNDLATCLAPVVE